MFTPSFNIYISLPLPSLLSTDTHSQLCTQQLKRFVCLSIHSTFLNDLQFQHKVPLAHWLPSLLSKSTARRRLLFFFFFSKLLLLVCPNSVYKKRMHYSWVRFHLSSACFLLTPRLRQPTWSWKMVPG